MSNRRIRIPATDASPEPAHYKRDSGACKRRCKGGNACDCDSHFKHVYHICHRADCPCHDLRVPGVTK